MGDRRKEALRVGFDRQIRLEFHGTKLSSDGGLIAYRDLDEACDLTASAAQQLFDFRTGNNIQHKMKALFRQSVYSRLVGYEDVNDAERLSVDPVVRHVVGGRAIEKQAASTSQVGRFETDVLVHPDNLATLMNMPGQWVDAMHQRRPIRKLILDMDSSVSQTYGQQEGTVYNGHFGCTCYHPLFLFNQDGDVERALLRKGNVHSADDWLSVLEPVIERYRLDDIPKFFRGDAAFALPELYELLEAEDYRYAIRLKDNSILQQHIRHLLTRPVGRPSNKPKRFYHSFAYQAKSWDRPRRVVAKVEWHPGELFPRVGFIVTNLTWSTHRVVEFYNQRGKAEQWIKEGKNAVRWTRLSCKHFDANQVRLQLHVLAYNLGNFLRRIALPQSVKRWTFIRRRQPCEGPIANDGRLGISRWRMTGDGGRSRSALTGAGNVDPAASRSSWLGPAARPTQANPISQMSPQRCKNEINSQGNVGLVLSIAVDLFVEAMGGL